ncbi:uncharacterized protein LOC109835335 [Asparagus officinalis]|uniref:uncharacterized protein LOC109835335 n=1 Tax=Asparagus officinalis TaxID=4686 RepID=UPI00098E6178|nr:uncharacterized protein LOC109835335 [Asparagus officinalis]
MDKSWMTLIRDRLSLRYRTGVDAFNKFAKVNAGWRSTIRCPCNKCMNLDWHEFGIVQDHLVRYGIMVSYKIWFEFGIVQDHLVRYGIMVSYKIWLHNGELPDNQHGDSGDDRDEREDDNRDEYPELLEDHCRGTYMDNDDIEMDHDVRNFEKLLEASQREMYPGCKNFTLLAFAVKMLYVKVENKWSNKSFDMVLQIFRDLLLEGHLVQGSIYETKKLLRDLGMGYEQIDACQYDCVLFWKENSHLIKCPVCGESRYKFISRKGMKIPRKVLCYFSLTPRLRRLYMSRKTATEMRWYRDKRVDDGIGHPADTEEWKEFDIIHPEFAQEIRNVRLGLASDGFNPFGNMSNANSMWPIILIPYNLPPWLCMKESFFMMSLLIPGPHAPGNDIDVFLRPLVDELKELWDNEVVTYDASKKQISGCMRLYCGPLMTFLHMVTCLGGAQKAIWLVHLQ